MHNAHHIMDRGEIALTELEMKNVETQEMGESMINNVEPREMSEHDTVHSQMMGNRPSCIESRPRNLKTKCRAHHLRN